MKSTIRVDFKGPTTESKNGFEPVLRVFLTEDKETQKVDVRDNLLKAFFEQIGGTSSWLRVEFVNHNSLSDETMIEITPVKPNELKSEMVIMNERIDIEDRSIKN